MGETVLPIVERVFKRPAVELLSIRGTGCTGKWVLKVETGEEGPAGLKRKSFVVEFMPKNFRHCRIGLLGAGGATTEAGTGLVMVPESIGEAFESFIREQYALRKTAMRRTRQGPRYLINVMATMLLNEDLTPDESAVEEISAYILRHFSSPQFIQRCVGKSNNHYHFGDESIGRFFMVEVPSEVG